MRWVVFVLMVMITPVAFGGDLTAARLYLQNASPPKPAAKPWRVRRAAMYGACFGAAINVFGTLLGRSPMPDFLILVPALAASALIFAGVGAGGARLRNWIVRAK